MGPEPATGLEFRGLVTVNGVARLSHLPATHFANLGFLSTGQHRGLGDRLGCRAHPSHCLRIENL